MADPNTCSSSWLALAELLSERFSSEDRGLANLSSRDLTTAVAELKSQIIVQGNSDRVEMYRYVLDGCPDNRVLLVYGHLADLMSATGAFSGYTVAVPHLLLQPVVRPLAVTRRDNHFDTTPSLSPLLTQFKRALLPAMRLPTNSPSPALEILHPVPDYATMSRLLDQWNGSETAQTGK